MNTIEPEDICGYLYNNHLPDCGDTVVEECELKRNKWFIEVLERDAISNEEEDRLKIFNELNIFGYIYIGKLKVHKILYKFLYYLKLIR